MDSAQTAIPETGRRDAQLAASRVEPLVTSRGILLMQTIRWTRGDGSVVIARVGVSDGEQVGVGATLADALVRIGATGAPGRADARPPLTLLEEPTDGLAGRLYDTMRQALQRGDWATFGVAFDSLGRVLQRPPQ
jgi:uncharacterized membrane protein (UPF0182 family)